MSGPTLYTIMHGNVEKPRPVRFRLDRGDPRSSYDGAQTHAGNERHWANADGLSAKAANSPEVRRKLRERARLEFDNGGNCKGAIETIGHDLIGTGPRLQLTLPEGVHPDAAKAIERKFRDWCDAINFADKLRIMIESELRDGEIFAQRTTNEAIKDQVKLDLRLIETELVCSPYADPFKDRSVDGIEFSMAGNPTRYHVLNQHPGDLNLNSFASSGQWIPASEIVHWFRSSRAGNVRGIPRITPGIPLLAMIRGYSSATLAAARLGSQMAGVMETNLPPDGGPVSVAAYDSVPFEDGTMLTLPAGWKVNQVRAEQPTSTYPQFKDTNLTEFGRSIHVPRNVVTGDSSGYNFSSARLDHLLYRGALKIDRNRKAVITLDRAFVWWTEEALLIPDYIPREIYVTLPPVSEWTWTWQFDGFPSINPVDDANANEINLHNGMVTPGELLAERGIDWEDHFVALARQLARAKELGIVELVFPWLVKAQAAAAPPMPARTNEGTRGQPQSRHGAEYQSEVDTWLEEETSRV